MAKTNQPKTRIGLLEDALHGLQQYLKTPDANLTTAVDYMQSLISWAEEPQEDSSNPGDNPPPPPGHG